ncbi:MAG: alpha/beta fold hydrolase [Flavobacteriales bacterium]|nr:alpha/beta fold hydrolase [Flavobacteriales bacterium]
MAACIAAGCNVVKTIERQGAKAFREAGMEARSFAAATGQRSVWASSTISRNEKPKLLLIHGITSSHAMWAGNLPALRERFDLIAPDLIGHGRTTAAWSGNSVDEQVRHIVSILDSLKVNEPVFVVGNSYGGAIAANFAEQRPERTRGLVIYDGPASDYTRAMADSVARSVGAADIAALFTPTNADEQRRLVNTAFYAPPKIPRFALKQMHRRLSAQRAKHLALLQDLLHREAEYATKAYQWNMPVHVIWGEGDKLIPLAVGRGIVKRSGLPENRLIIIPKAGHIANSEQKDAFESHLLRVLKDGPCPDPAIASEGPCTKELRQVCGCDGQTYANPCLAWRAGARVEHLGACVK